MTPTAVFKRMTLMICIFLGKLLQKRNALFITCYRHIKVILSRYNITVFELRGVTLLLHYVCVTFIKITGRMDLVFSIDILVFNVQLITQQEVMWYGIMTKLSLRLTKVQYNRHSYGSLGNTFYNRRVR